MNWFTRERNAQTSGYNLGWRRLHIRVVTGDRFQSTLTRGTLPLKFHTYVRIQVIKSCTSVQFELLGVAVEDVDECQSTNDFCIPLFTGDPGNRFPTH